MKTPSFRKRSLAGWALMTGTLGLTTPALAQVSPYLPASTEAATVHRTAALPADAQTRLEAIEIELAWLADPVTFPYHLTIYPAGLAFDVRGFVPSDAVRTHALKLARARTRRTVTDTIRIHPGMANGAAAAPADALQKGAAQALSEVLGERISTLNIRANANGQISLAGSVSCYEEKLTLSRRLRGLRGCTSVENHLSVVTVLREGKLYHLLTADGQHKVPAHPEVLHVNHATPRTAAAMPTVEAGKHRQPADRPVPLPPAPTPTRPSPVVTAAPKPVAAVTQTAFQPETNPPVVGTAPAEPSAPATAQPGPAPRVVLIKIWETPPGSLVPVQREIPLLLSGTGRGQATRPLYEEEIAKLRALQEQRQHPPAPQPGPALQPSPNARKGLTPGDKPRPATAASAAPSGLERTSGVARPVEPGRPPQPTVPVVPAAAPPITRRPAPSVTEPRPVQPSPVINTQRPQPELSRLPPAQQPSAMPSPTASKPAASATQPNGKTPQSPTLASWGKGIWGENPNLPPPQPLPASVREGPEVQAHRVPAPVSPPAPLVTKGVVTIAEPVDNRSAAAPRPAPVAPAPYVTRGTVTFHEEPAPAVAPKRSLAELRQRIEKVCGSEAREVEVVQQSAKSLRIQFKVARVEDGPRLSEKILRLPELAPYEVAMEIRVAASP